MAKQTVELIKEETRKIFILKCLSVSTELKNICLQARHEIIPWVTFMEDFTKEIEKLKKLFKSL